MNRDQDLQMVFKGMEQLKPEHLTKTEYTVAELRPEDPRSDQVRRVILPVNNYIYGDMGYEIMPVDILAKYCPWDMTRTLVKIRTDHTDILGNLHDIVVEDAEVHKHLKALEGGES